MTLEVKTICVACPYCFVESSYLVEYLDFRCDLVLVICEHDGCGNPYIIKAIAKPEISVIPIADYEYFPSMAD